MKLRANFRCSAGFTLIEAIMVIVITGILAGIVAVFITKPVQSYTDSVRRAELTDAADVALRRITRDIRLALPNSLRVTTTGGTTYIEFIMTSVGARYRDSADGSDGGDVLDFTSTTDKTFDVIGTMPTNPAIAVGDFIVINNQSAIDQPLNAYLRGSAQCGAAPVAPGCNIAAVTGIAGNVVTLDANPFAYQLPQPMPSPNSRFQVVPSGIRAVTFACPSAVSGNLMRYWGYGFSTAQPTTFGAGSSALLAANSTCSVDYATSGSSRNALLYIQLTLKDIPSGESVVLFKQVHVDNSP